MSIMPGIETRAPERTETSSGSAVVAELLAGGLFDMGERCRHFGVDFGREFGAAGEIGDALLGGDGEARRHRQADRGHFGEVRALAADHRLVARAGIVVRRTAAESVDLPVHILQHFPDETG